MAGAGALARHPLGVDFRRPAAGWGFIHALALPCFGRPQRPSRLFLFCSLFGKTEPPVKILFF
jgi:hypothetical protein